MHARLKRKNRRWLPGNERLRLARQLEDDDFSATRLSEWNVIPVDPARKLTVVVELA